MITLKHFIKDEDFGLKVWSQLCQLWTDQLVGWIEGKWNKMLCVHSPTMAQFTAATPPLLLALQEHSALQQKRIIHDEIQYIQRIEGTLPKGLILVQ